MENACQSRLSSYPGAGERLQVQAKEIRTRTEGVHYYTESEGKHVGNNLGSHAGLRFPKPNSSACLAGLLMNSLMTVWSLFANKLDKFWNERVHGAGRRLSVAGISLLTAVVQLQVRCPVAFIWMRNVSYPCRGVAE